jgi:regulator of RNase E activity RraA
MDLLKAGAIVVNAAGLFDEPAMQAELHDGCGRSTQHPQSLDGAIMIGLQILRRQRAVGLALAEQFRAVPVANVSDCMSRMTAGGARLRPMHAGGYMSGPALTVKVRPGDNLLVHKALRMAVPSDVIIGDDDGVLCVPFDQAESLLAAGLQKGLAETKMVSDRASGKYDAAWIDENLKRIGWVDDQ